MSLDNIRQHLNNKQPPDIDSWDPPYCGEMDICIKADGRWFYNGSAINRRSLVKLFASVLKKEGERYFLVTPVEKIGIKVEDQPFVISQWHQNVNSPVITLHTNLDEQLTLTAKNPLIIENDKLLVLVRRNLYAKVSRNVFYQWVEIAKEVHTNSRHELVITSDNIEFSLGQL
jgi:hypothetical protein